MHDLMLGKIIDGEVNRDAVHIAVAPVVAECRLDPGEHIGLVLGSQEIATNDPEKFIGIVDPFLDCLSGEGER